MKADSQNLVGYCGLYCGACGIKQGKIRQAVQNLRKIIAAYGFDKIVPELSKWEPSLKHYAEYEKVLDGLINLFGDCPACVAGGGDPACLLRKCCKEKNLRVCSECEEMESCDKLKQRQWALKRLQEIKAKGLDEWIKEMERKTAEGYCYLDEAL
ncbi:DUF3795 domain-containing protein [Candidatus Bathyarchaeota archaeon]|nr:DUF3795 domain-containing protein [Candidatus Bathyarchaeota archaeon]